MEVISDLSACPVFAGGSVVSIGVYDGVHLGHRSLIRRLQAMAAQLDAATAVVTFDPHPAAIVRPDSAPKLLTDLPQRLELLEAAGVDTTVVITFDKTASQESPEHFVRRVLVGCLQARAVVVGHDFHFGHGRRGNVPLLQRMGAEAGFDVLGISLVADGGNEAVSSTRIRRLLTEGSVEGAAALLGRPHEVRGTVEHGDARGRDLGFPTANVAVPAAVCLPADGIYAGWYERPDGSVHPTAISLGRRPTFYETADASLLEAYLLDFAGDLYGEAAEVRFVRRLRGELKFDSVETLVEQMSADVDATRQALSRQDA